MRSRDYRSEWVAAGVFTSALLVVTALFVALAFILYL